MFSGIFSFLLFLRSVFWDLWTPNLPFRSSDVGLNILNDWFMPQVYIKRNFQNWPKSKLSSVQSMVSPPPPHDDDFFVHQTLTIPPVMPLFLALNVLLDEESSWFLCQTFSDLTLVGFSFLAEKYMCLKLLLLWHGARQKLLCGYVCEKLLSQKSSLTDNHFAKKNSKKWVKKC